MSIWVCSFTCHCVSFMGTDGCTHISVWASALLVSTTMGNARRLDRETSNMYSDPHFLYFVQNYLTYFDNYLAWGTARPKTSESMKKMLSLCLIFTILFLSCTSLDDVEKRLDNLETAVKELQLAHDTGKLVSKVSQLDNNGGWEILFSDNTSIKVGASMFSLIDRDEDYVTFVLQDGNSLKFALLNLKLLSFSIMANDNPMQITADVKGEIIGDSVVDCWVPNIMSDKLLIPKAEFVGESVKFDDVPATIGSSQHDFKKPVKMTITNGSKSKDYTIYVHSYTGLPVMWIETEGRQDITSKEEYLRASFKLVEDVKTRAAGDVIEDSVSIKGRGNSTWGMPKKPYRLKFDKKQSVFGEPKDKSWVLLANYADKTMLRTTVAFYMGYISNLDYTPKAHFAELMLNGRYNGTYLFCDKLKISKERVNVGNDGYLLEIDGRATSEDVSFRSPHISQPIVIKEPDTIITDDDKFNYIKDYVNKADEVLYSDNFTDIDEGWQKYIDMDSFVDWFLINEITKNGDAIGYSSCYMNMKKGEKIKMGPLWDFDISLGNYDTITLVEGFWVKYAGWINRMFDDPAFVIRVKERFDYFYSKRDDIMREINANAMYHKYAVQENENRWHTFYTYTWPNYDIWGSYNNEVQSMKEWLNARFEWLKGEFDKM